MNDWFNSLITAGYNVTELEPSMFQVGNNIINTCDDGAFLWTKLKKTDEVKDFAENSLGNDIIKGNVDYISSDEFPKIRSVVNQEFSYRQKFQDGSEPTVDRICEFLKTVPVIYSPSTTDKLTFSINEESWELYKNGDVKHSGKLADSADLQIALAQFKANSQNSDTLSEGKPTEVTKHNVVL